jgi:hypothetical protein
MNSFDETAHFKAMSGVPPTVRWKGCSEWLLVGDLTIAQKYGHVRLDRRTTGLGQLLYVIDAIGDDAIRYQIFADSLDEAVEEFRRIVSLGR